MSSIREGRLKGASIIGRNSIRRENAKRRGAWRT
jgi:hypothetical protein